MEGESLTELADKENYLDAPSAAKHAIEWFRERLLVFVPDVETQTGDLDDPDKPNIVRAMSTVVAITEAPFLESYERVYTPLLHYLCVGSGIAGNNHRPRILQAIRRYGEQHRQVFKPRIHDVVLSDMNVKGTYLGSALFVPDSNELPKGTIALCLYPADEDPASSQIATGQAVFVGSNGVRAGIYANQDRAILGFGNGMPTEFAFPDPHLVNLFHLDTVIAILPTSVENPKPRMLVTRMDPKTSDLLNQDQKLAAKTAEPHSILENAAGPEDVLQDITFDDQTGDGWCPLPRVLQGDATRHKAALRIVPNDTFCRLRHEPPLDIENFFSIIGILLPSPVGDNDSSEVCLSFRSDGHFVGHAMDALSNCTLLRTASDIRSRLFRIMDEAILADVSGVTDVIPLWDGKDADPVGPNHQLLLLSDRKRLPYSPQNPMLKVGSGGFIASFGRKHQYYLMTPREPESILGYLACPVRHTIRKSDVEPGKTTRVSRADVVYARNETDRGAIFCLDWLDEAIQVTHQRSGAAAHSDPMGFARYWSEQRSRLGASVSAKQYFELFTRSDEDARYRLTFVERADDREERLVLSENDVIRIGPLLCRYHHRGTP